MRVAIYARVSRRRQAQTQTVDQRLERLRADATAQGWTVSDEQLFRDESYSGASLQRPGLEQ